MLFAVIKTYICGITIKIKIMKINWSIVIEGALAVIVGMAIYKVLDVLFLDKAVSKLSAHFEEHYEEHYNEND